MSQRHNSNNSNSRLKFTKGEKCIFTHVVLTFCLVLITVMIYLVHLYLVDHNTYTLFNTRRLAPTYDIYPFNPLTDQNPVISQHLKEEAKDSKTDFFQVLRDNKILVPQVVEGDSLRLDAIPIGIIYLNITPVLQTCNTLLLRTQWSLGPGHCIALMSQPDLSHILFEWRVKYRDNDGVIIKRRVVHPHFDADTFENNIGVIYHRDIIGLQEYNLPNTNYEKLNNDLNSEGKLIIISWLEDASLIEDHKNHIAIFPVQLLPKENCRVQMAPIVDLRSYETCAVFEKVVYTSLGHGALALQINNLQVFGLFTWGEKTHRTFPLVILNLSYFQEWVEIAMTL